MDNQQEKEIELSFNAIDMAYDMWKNSSESMKNNNATYAVITKERRRIAAMLLNIELPKTNKVGLTAEDFIGNHTDEEIEYEMEKVIGVVRSYINLASNVEAEEEKLEFVKNLVHLSPERTK